MWRLGLAQTRAGWRRLIAAGTAVALGALFVAVIMLTSGIFRNAALSAARDTLYGADFEISSLRPNITPNELAALEHVTDYYIKQTGYGALDHAGRQAATTIVTQPPPELSGRPLDEGRHPTGPGEISLPTTLASKLNAEVGSTVEFLEVAWDEESLTPHVVHTGVEFTVTGLTSATDDETWGSFEAYVTPETLDQALPSFAAEMMYSQSVYVSTNAPHLLEEELGDTGWVSSYYSTADSAQGVFRQFTGMTNPIMSVSVIFALIAVGVAGLVVSNTLQVLVTQRAALIGVLRSVGATRGQIRSAVVLEAAVVGGIGGLVGTSLAHVVVALGLAVLQRTGIGASWTTSLGFQPAALVVPVLVGIVVTILASLLPSRAAANIKPLEAVRRLTSPRVRPSTSVYLLGLLVSILGIATTLVALTVRSSITSTADVDTSALIALAGLGVAIFGMGLLTISPLIFPRIAHVVGAVLQRLAPRVWKSPVRLARTNLRSNVRRTTATSNALLVGVALVTLLVTGAASSRASLTAVAAGMQPTDVIVTTSHGGQQGIPFDALADVSRIDGVEAVARVWSAGIRVSPPDDGYQMDAELFVADPAELEAVSYSDSLLSAEDSGTLVMDPSWGFTSESVNVQHNPSYYDAANPEFVPRELESAGPVINLDAVLRAAPGGVMMATADTARTLGIATSGAPNQLWIRTQPGMIEDVGRAVAAVLPAGEDYGLDTFTVATPGTLREQIDSAISTVVTSVAGLLAISIFIALVGVANTLSLSVFERRREIALLRSVGLTRTQLRASLAAEGLIITTVATLVGLVVGAGLGFAGSTILFAGAAGTHLVVPWTALGLIVVFALVAGPLASALPARQALRSTPVASLSEE
ncbi:MAG: ABC transporter permease [bacterium]|nr:ABC transporter permease [bacterium]